jgi:hypothetical protein
VKFADRDSVCNAGGGNGQNREQQAVWPEYLNQPRFLAGCAE